MLCMNKTYKELPFVLPSYTTDTLVPLMLLFVRKQLGWSHTCLYLQAVAFITTISLKMVQTKSVYCGYKIILSLYWYSSFDSHVLFQWYYIFQWITDLEMVQCFKLKVTSRNYQKIVGNTAFALKQRSKAVTACYPLLRNTPLFIGLLVF